jgi:hypothetical protein
MTGIQPATLLEDEALYAASIEQAERAEWTTLHELMAVNAEVTHAVLCQLKASAGAKQNDIPQPLRFPRPGEKKPKKIVLSGLDAARAIMGGG